MAPSSTEGKDGAARASPDRSSLRGLLGRLGEESAPVTPLTLGSTALDAAAGAAKAQGGSFLPSRDHAVVFFACFAGSCFFCFL